MPIIIRPATAQDLPQIRQLEEQWAAASETIGFQPTPIQELTALLGACFLVAAEENILVGFTCAQTKQNTGSMSAIIEGNHQYLDIENLYVAPPQRSRGIGQQLIQATTDWAKKHRIRYLSAYSSTRNVDRILSFYRACGFQSWSVQMFRDLEKMK